jgi:FemAB-related protein (PEP-CTERM system-associated)
MTVEQRSETAQGGVEASWDRCHVTTLAPQQCADWDAYVAGHPDGTLFHTVAWRDAVKEAFGHEDVYLTAVRGHRIVGVLPVFFVASRIAGRMLVSVPYGVGGGIVANDGEAVEALFEAAKEVAHTRRCEAIDLRSERAIVPNLSIVDRYVGFRRALPENVDQVLEWLPRKARAAARNARNKHRLTVSFGDEHLKEVWRLYSVGMRRLGSLTYPFAFLERLLEHTPGHHWVSLVQREGRSVAGLVTFLFQDSVMPYFIGTTDEARRCSAANFIYLTAMERGVALGYRVFDFGRSRCDNAGSCDFKRFNGFEPRPLGYQMYIPPGCAAPDLSPSNPKFRIARRVWPHLPLWVTRAVGGRMAKHIPG